MSTLLQDLRYGLRMLARNPGFTAVAVITLALGIGANSAVFSVIYAVLLRPLPYSDPDSLMLLETTVSQPGKPVEIFPEWSYPRYEFVRDHNDVFEQVAAFSDREFTLTDSGNPERVHVEVVSPSYFQLLGIKAALGRVFLPDEDKNPGGHPVALMGDGLWRRRFGGDPNLLGKTIHVNKVPLTVVGILPPGFKGQLGSAEVWVPLMMAPELEGIPTRLQQKGAFWHQVAARLKPGVSPAQARGRLAVLEAQLEAAVPPPGRDANWGIQVVPLKEAETDPAIRKSLLVLFAAVALVMLIACVNVANLLLARATTRQREIAIRLAIGASRARVMRQLLTESLLLALVAGIVALLVATWGIELVAALQPSAARNAFWRYTRLPDFSTIHLDAPVLAFNLLFSLATGLVFGLFPARKASNPDLNESLKESTSASPRGSRALGPLGGRQTLVVAEVSLALMLLVGAGLMVRSLARLLTTRLGFTPENLITLKIDLPQSYSEAAGTAFFQQLLARAASLPGAESVCLTNAVPLASSYDRTIMTLAAHGTSPERSQLFVGVHPVSPGLLETLHAPLLKGRWLSDEDREATKVVAVINEAAARKYWPDEDPLGQHISLGIGSGPNGTSAEIVGIVGDVKYDSVDAQVGPDVYLSYLQSGYGGYFLVVRSLQSASTMVPALRRHVIALDRDIPIYDVATMEQRISSSTSHTRFVAFLLGAFAGLALALAAIGIYGVMSYSVAQRTHEIGLRMALGAESRDVMRLVVGQGMTLTLLGVAAGLAGAFALTRFLASMLYGVRPTDPLTFAGVSLLLTGVAALASYIPARRATKVDPMVALRYE
jgi:putative ABC transport system permease protein